MHNFMKSIPVDVVTGLGVGLVCDNITPVTKGDRGSQKSQRD